MRHTAEHMRGSSDVCTQAMHQMYSQNIVKRIFLHQGLKWFIKIASHRCDTKFKLRRICLVLHRNLILR
jgi:hypothetical protein